MNSPKTSRFDLVDSNTGEILCDRITGSLGEAQDRAAELANERKRSVDVLDVGGGPDGSTVCVVAIDPEPRERTEILAYVDAIEQGAAAAVVSRFGSLRPCEAVRKAIEVYRELHARTDRENFERALYAFDDRPAPPTLALTIASADRDAREELAALLRDFEDRAAEYEEIADLALAVADALAPIPEPAE